MNQTHAIRTTTAEPARLLLIEDDEAIAGLIRLHLSSDYSLTVEHDGLTGFRRAEEEQWSAILLDLRLPSKDGLEICRDLRARLNDTPLLMLTSRSGELDRVLGLEMGADDYLVKPFSMLELGARVKALIRRSATGLNAVRQVEVLSAAGLTLNQRSRECSRDGHPLELTSKEFDLLAWFMAHPGTVFSRSELLEHIWGYAHSGYEHTVNSHINRLRAKLETDPSSPGIIVTVWGVGYRFNAAS